MRLVWTFIAFFLCWSKPSFSEEWRPCRRVVIQVRHMASVRDDPIQWLRNGVRAYGTLPSTSAVGPEVADMVQKINFLEWVETHGMKLNLQVAPSMKEIRKLLADLVNKKDGYKELPTLGFSSDTRTLDSEALRVLLEFTTLVPERENLPQLERILIPPYAWVKDIWEDVDSYVSPEIADGIKGIAELWQEPEMVLELLYDLRKLVDQEGGTKEDVLEKVRLRLEREGGFSELYKVEPPESEADTGSSGFLADSQWHRLLAEGRPISDGGVPHSWIPTYDDQPGGINVHRNQWAIIMLAWKKYPQLFGRAAALPPVEIYKAFGDEKWVNKWKDNKRKASKTDEPFSTPWGMMFDVADAEIFDHFRGLKIENEPKAHTHFSQPEYFQIFFEKIVGVVD